MDVKLPIKKSVNSVNVENAQSLLQVRGFDFLQEEILSKMQQLATLIDEAKAYFAETQKLDLIFSTVFIKKMVSYQHLPEYVDKKTFFIPLITFRNARRDISSWVEISKALDEANATVDERLIHMRIFFSNKDFYFRGRQLAEDLRCIWSLEIEMNRMLKLENMPLKTLPDFMLYSESKKSKSKKDS